MLGFEDDGWKVGEDGARGGVPIGEGGHQEGEGKVGAVVRGDL